MLSPEWKSADELGLAPRALRDALAGGHVIRVRRGRYLPATTHPHLLEAARLGCRLDCVSLLHALGVFVLDPGRLHVNARVGSSRLPPAHDGVVRHWRRDSDGRASTCVDVVTALTQACRCQEPRAAIATLDSAWHLGVIDAEGVAEVFHRLPRAFGRLRPLLDPSAESGAESLLRLILRALGCRFETQVDIPGVGRVDFVVDGWLIIECDSAAHHSDWTAQRRDKRRDLVAASLGYTTVRPIAEDIFHRRDELTSRLRATLAAHTAAQLLTSRGRGHASTAPRPGGRAF